VADNPSPDFKVVAAQALEMAHLLLPDWIGGHRVGREWKGERRANGGPGDSWSINLDTGKWIHGATGEGGLDMVSMYASRNHLSQVDALHQVFSMVGGADRRFTLPVKAPPAPAENPCEEIPPDAPEIPDHRLYGRPAAVYRYGWAFVIARYEPRDQTKSFSPLTWRGNKWVFKGYPAPRPIYGAENLHKYPEGPIIVVEGEKACDAARVEVSNNFFVTWSGGAGSVDKNDWSVLKDRDVILWPDADEPGWKAMGQLAQILSKLASRVRVVDTHGMPEGWDLADAIADKWDGAKIASYVKEHIKTSWDSEPESVAGNGVDHDPPPYTAADEPSPSPDDEPTPPELDPEPSTAIEPVRNEVQEPSALLSWQNCGLNTNQGGLPFPTMANASLLILNHSTLKGHIWYDTFRDKTYHDMDGYEERWTDDHDRQLTVKFQQQLGLDKFKTSLVAEGRMHAAFMSKRNSLVDWLKSLKWDGVERLNTWLADCLGIERNPYTDAVSRNFAIAMIARAIWPGCKMDNMIILEAPMGVGKSTFLQTLGGMWYKSLIDELGDKPFLESIKGSWLVEIPDLAGFTRSQHSKVIASLTICTDEYRKSYGHMSEAHPRTCVFVATSEKDDYLVDMAGSRRYWPLRCTEVDLDALKSQREQVFAEAILRYEAHEPWWIIPGALDEQHRRSVVDPWNDEALDEADHIWERAKLSSVQLFVTSDQLLARIGIDLKDRTQSHKNRIARIMNSNGWIQKSNGRMRYWKKVERKD
jgi:putative DNA primase/helicase